MISTSHGSVKHLFTDPNTQLMPLSEYAQLAKHTIGKFVIFVILMLDILLAMNLIKDFNDFIFKFDLASTR